MITFPAQGKRYVVMGLGLSGISAAQALIASRAEVWGWDDQEELRDKAIKLDIPVCPLDQIEWSSITALVLSPGIPHLYPEPHVSAHKARQLDIPIICDIDLLAQAQSQARYVGITGTNGKSTTTALIGHILEALNQPFQIGGNIGVPALSLDPLGEGGTYVLELSSYQLERVPHLNLEVGILLNITPDHLKRHGGLEGYIRAKKNLFKQAGRNFKGIIGVDDPYCRSIYEEIKEKHPMISVSTQGHADICIKDGILWEGKESILSLSDNSALLGEHNAQNIGAAYALAKYWGISQAAFKERLKSFKGLEHRLEYVEAIGGVQFINDSKATNAEAAAKALSCFKNIYWILGGQPKETGLKGLESFFGYVKSAFLIGEASQEFAEVLKGKVSFQICGTLENATRLAFEQARKDKDKPVVLLSPACASWDQFKSFEHRGEVFKKVVEELKLNYS
jgi:UDP-N-acetylmuramoylalanine--D-glutamate ligase